MGGLSDFGSALPHVSVAHSGLSSRRKRGRQIDHSRRPAGVRVRLLPRPQIARLRADAKICDFRGHCSGYPEFGVPGSRREFMGGISSGIPAARLLPSPRRVLDAAAGKKRGPGTGRFRRPAGVRARESPRPQIARFRADAKICDVRRHCRGSPEIGISGRRQEFARGKSIRFRRCVSRLLRFAFWRGVSENRLVAPTRGGPR